MGFFDTDFGGPMPWMADCDTDKWIDFEIQIASLTPVDSQVPFGSGYDAATGKMGQVTEAIAEMRNILNVDDGEHTIPFWACSELQTYLEPLLKSLKGKWTEMRFKRTEFLKKDKVNSKAEFEVVLD